MQFTLAEARDYAARERIEEWVHAYLNGPANNPGFTEGLQKQQRWWVGPVEIEMTRLLPALGPAPEFEYHVERASFERKINSMLHSLRNYWSPEPLIAEYRGVDNLSVRDGNNRYEALRRFGYSECWTIIYFSSSKDHRLFLEDMNST